MAWRLFDTAITRANDDDLQNRILGNNFNKFKKNSIVSCKKMHF